MKKALSFLLGISFFAFVASCGGSLTPEQREKARRAIEEGQIKRITPAQLTETALSTGKDLVAILNKRDIYLNDLEFVDSLSQAKQVKIYALKADMDAISTQEKSILEAYQSTDDISGIGDNIQKLPGDSLFLYTHPVGNEHPDGTKSFMFAIAIKMAVKDLVLSIKE